MLHETREQRRERIHATKKNSQKKKLRERYRKRPLTPSEKSRLASEVENGVVAKVRRWFQQPGAADRIEEYRGYMVRAVADLLEEIATDYKIEPTPKPPSCSKEKKARTKRRKQVTKILTQNGFHG